MNARELEVGMRCVYRTDARNAVPSRDGEQCVLSYVIDTGEWQWMIEFDDETHLPAFASELTPLPSSRAEDETPS